MDWCRQAGSGPVAVGGSSLGAQTAKSIAMRAVNWPQRLRPDALLAIIHTNAIAQTALNSSLSDIWNLSGALRDAGWSKGLSEQWLQRLDPLQPSCLPAENVVSVTGSADSVTLESEAHKQLDYWQVPQQNRFSYRRGHFTVPLGMLRDTQPLDRFREVLRTCEH